MFNSLSRTGKRQNGVQIKYLRGSPITKGEGGGGGLLIVRQHNVNQEPI